MEVGASPSTSLGRLRLRPFFSSISLVTSYNFDFSSRYLGAPSTDSMPSAKSSATIPKSWDDKLDQETPSNGSVKPAISVRSGPMADLESSKPHVNGVTNGATNGKRKSRGSLTNGKTYKESSSSDEDNKPLVSHRDSFFPGASQVQVNVQSDQAPENLEPPTQARARLGPERRPSCEQRQIHHGQASQSHRRPDW
jgi:hypothetical protein